MQQREEVRSSAEGGNRQSREMSRSATPSDLQSRVQRLSEARRLFRTLNRQIPELETLLTLRKQRMVDCSNRQEIQFCKNEILTQKLRHSASIHSSSGESRPHISNRELWGLEILQLAENNHRRPVLLANFEPNHRAGFRASVAAVFRPAAFPLSPGSLEPAGRPGKSWQRNPESK
jgi:hypothetical protein